MGMLTIISLFSRFNSLSHKDFPCNAIVGHWMQAFNIAIISIYNAHVRRTFFLRSGSRGPVEDPGPAMDLYAAYCL